ncbi:spermidine/putrescine-binding periplasmic protein [Gottschalkia purinilytica]|uniref:Spermidine/putrescine-binding periplasmic protein n=1 Tax=Gottschalkia purinilytica TaxID=1503 RepID=A0A0L0W8U2_GOTPU|nr:ABC transporter substrate-binding protein [Gottschalkia purinilytica]KNF07871.1 spermidine/putrescine-binding periplasmic protein [Gottschalkia purinilytica]
MRKLGKKIILIIVSFSVLILGISGCNNKNIETIGKENKETLIISIFNLNEDLLRENAIKPFEKKHNVKVILEFGNNIERFNRLKKDNNRADVILLADYYAMQAIEEGLFEKMNHKNIPNIENLYDVAKYPLGKDYGPAYTIGSFGIIYDSEDIKDPIESWGDLWRPDLKGKMSLPNITTTSGPMVLLMAAEQAGADIKEDEDKAFEKMKELSENDSRFDDKSSEIINAMNQGKVKVMGGHSFEFESIKEVIPTVKWVDPKEGSYAIVNTINIVKGTKKKKLAEEFVNWFLSEEVQKAQALDKIDSPANKKVKLTPEEAEGLVYGEETIKNLKMVDWKYINKSLEKWIERWNKEISTDMQ